MIIASSLNRLDTHRDKCTHAILISDQQKALRVVYHIVIKGDDSKNIAFGQQICITTFRFHSKNTMPETLQPETLHKNLVYSPFRNARALLSTIGFGGAMIQRVCSNSDAICKDLDWSPTYDQWSFLPVKSFLHSPNAKICAVCTNKLT